MIVVPPSPRVRAPRAGERGIALLLVMLLSLILIPFAGEFAMQVQLESQTAMNVAQELQVENAIDGQYEVMLSYLRFDAESNDVDSKDDEWNSSQILSRTELGSDVALTTHPYDEQGKFNLRLLADKDLDRRKLAKERFQRLLREFRRDTENEISDGDAETWANEISEYLSKGPIRANIPSPSMADNRTILILEELDFLPPVRDQRFSFLLYDQRKEDKVSAGLARYLTLYGTGKLNLNTADAVVLRAYFFKNPELADRIVEHRETAPSTDDSSTPGDTTGGSTSGTTSGATSGTTTNDTLGATSGNPFTSVDQLSQVDGIDAQALQANQVDPSLDFDVRSSFFSFRIIGEKETSRRDELFVVERVPGAKEGEPIQGFRLLLRQERTDILEDVGTPE